MVNKRRFILAVMILLLLSVKSLYAGPALIGSPRWVSTAGRFGSVGFLEPRWFPYTDFDRWFGAIAFSSNFEYKSNPWAGSYTSRIAQLGFATRLGGMYLALYYGGNAWNAFGMGVAGNVHNFTERNEGGRIVRVYDMLPEFITGDRAATLYNEFSLLIGVADMGFRFSYGTSFQSLQLTDSFIVTGGPDAGYFRSYQTDVGHRNPQFVWGMARDLIPGRGIRPELMVDLNFNYNFIKREQYSAGFGSALLGQRISRSQNNLFMELRGSLGGFNLAEINDLRFGVDIEYTFATRIFINNYYSFEPSPGRFQIAPIRGGYQTSNMTIYEETWNNHRINPSFSAIWFGDRLALGAGLGLGLSVVSENRISLGFRTGSEHLGTLVRDGEATQTSVISFNPVFDLGMRWEIVPERLFLNAGSAISFGSPTVVIVNGRWYEQNVEIVRPGIYPFRSRRNADHTETDGARTDLRVGITFNPTANIELEAVSGVATGTNSINVFDLPTRTGLLNFSSIVLTINF